MKHLSLHGNTVAVHSGKWRSMLLILLLALIGLGQSHLHAQCNIMSAYPDPAMPLMIKIDDACAAKVRAADLLQMPDDCAGTKTVTLRDGLGEAIATGTDSVTIDASTYINQLLNVTVSDDETTLFSVSHIVLLDDTPPVIDCQDISLTCIEEATIVIIEVPEVTDNCDPDAELTYHDEVIGDDCEKVIERTWTAMDASGNESTCVQMITITRPNLEDVVFPQDTVMNCDVADTTLLARGEPMIADMLIRDGAFCSLVATRRDSIEATCGGIEYEIHRFWTVTDTCTEATVRDTQLIVVQDTIAPEFELAEMFTVQNDPGECYATVNLPSPELTDNCDDDPRFFVSTSYGGVGLGPHMRVPVGAHTVQYTAVDTCGNTRVKRLQLRVVDDEAPAAICEGATTIGIPAVGTVTVPARTFNKGSKDNCAPMVFFKVKKMEPGTCDEINGDDAPAQEGYQEWFDDAVAFCCEEISDKPVQVIFRVYEIDPGAGPVDPAREMEDGDLHGRYNECMVTVELQDELPPVIKCPANVTINCTDDYSDLSVFGSPEVFEPCGYTLDSTVVRNLDDCGEGIITRTFTATDRYGNQSSCTQTITLVNPTPLKAEDIKWPGNFLSNVCGIGTDPDDLPDTLRRPVITNTSCNYFAVSYSDQFFDVGFPACFKILRTWEVIDWCRYDPGEPEKGGKFSYTQTIKVEDNVAPEIACPQDIVVSTNSSCGSVRVNIPPVTAEDCSPNVSITNNSPYADANGADASGIYPVGTTIVKYIIKDGCGNATTCQISVTVEDQKAPSPVCIVGLSVDLVISDGETRASVNAKSFNGGSTDNCTPRDKLRFTLRRPGTNTPTPPTDTVLTFGCEDVGTQLIEFWVTDEKGNSDYCVTYIDVQDNNGLCPLPTTGMIAGGIQTEQGQTVENVGVRVNSSIAEGRTNEHGRFEFPGLPIGHDYTIVPQKNDDLRNGVSTVDLVLISRHILGVQLLDSPYKIIAADVDRSGSIGPLDLIILRQMVLGVIEELPNYNRSWRFIQKNYRFQNPQNPLREPFPEIYNVNDFDGESMKTDFVAIKVGDVDFSARPNSLAGGESRAVAGKTTFTLEDRLISAGETVTIALKATNAAQMLGYQFAIQYDAQVLDFVNLDYGDFPGMNDKNFGLHYIDEGIITTSWNAGGTEQAPDDAVIYKLTLQARSAVQLSEVFRLSPRYLASEVYNTNMQTFDIELDFTVPTPEVVMPNDVVPVEDDFHLYQNAPNPFATQTVVPFELPETTYAKLTIFDGSGRVVYVREGEFPQGRNEITINRTEVNAKGMLYYRLETLGRHATKKMILLD